MKTTTATYQCGVDILGFPIYVEHHLTEGSINQQNGYKSTPRRIPFFKVTQTEVKQH